MKKRVKAEVIRLQPGEEIRILDETAAGIFSIILIISLITNLIQWSHACH